LRELLKRLNFLVEVGPSGSHRIEVLKMGGPIGAYATDTATPRIPFWLVKKGSKSDPFRREPKWRTCFDADMRAPLEGGGVFAEPAPVLDATFGFALLTVCGKW
jgi:hypothetical protein